MNVIMYCVLLVLIQNQTFIVFASDGCRLSMKYDFGVRQPLLLKCDTTLAGYSALYWPDDDNYVHLSENETAIVDCPGRTLVMDGEPFQQSSSARVIICLGGHKFEDHLTGSVATFDTIQCSERVVHVARYKYETCVASTTAAAAPSRGGELIEIGFDLTDGRFLTMMTVCFDTTLQSTLYSYALMTPRIKGRQFGHPNIYFVEDPQFYDLGDVEMYQLYALNRQRASINRLVGLADDDQLYVRNHSNCFISRGHLTAKMDMVFGALQDATFHYVNAAPQWSALNAGTWNDLEISVRDYVTAKQISVDVYTGTHGIATLPHSENAVPVPLFLYNAYNTHGHIVQQAVPVPLLFWKIVYAPAMQAGVAFINVNNPYATHADLDALRLCTDICHLLNEWELRWNSAPPRSSSVVSDSYCCYVNQLTDVIGDVIPKTSIRQLLN